MRLALFTDTYEPDVNGVARTLGRWADYLRRQGAAVKVFAPDPADGTASHTQFHHVERFVSLPFFLYPECRLALPNTRSIRRALESFRPTLVHVATPFNLGLCGIHYARKYNVPLIASYHTHFDRYLPFYNLQWMVKMLGRYMAWFHQDCARIFVPSRAALEELVRNGWERERLDIWSRGLDGRMFHPGGDREAWLAENGLDPRRFTVFYAGRLAPEKNVDVAIDAFATFRERTCPDAQLVLAGDGPSFSQLYERCEREKLPVRFLGFTTGEPLRRWYASADVFLFPSSTETFGNVVLEAMACGAPVIAADAGGVTDTVRHMENGLRCGPGDPAAFCEALETLYLDAALSKRLAMKGRAHAMRQSWDAIFADLHSKCERLQSNSPFSQLLHTIQ
jgi:glycosyltransferase involved in cell wall biosynthesis